MNPISDCNSLVSQPPLNHGDTSLVWRKLRISFPLDYSHKQEELQLEWKYLSKESLPSSCFGENCRGRQRWKFITVLRKLMFVNPLQVTASNVFPPLLLKNILTLEDYSCSVLRNFQLSYNTLEFTAILAVFQNAVKNHCVVGMELHDYLVREG